MKKFISLFMLFAFVTVQANAATLNSLKTAYDELNYSLGVEWDQKDKAFYAEATKTFQDKVQELQDAGLTNAELLDFAKSQLKDENLIKEIETTLTLVQVNMLSQKEARKMMVDTLEKSYSQGASWSSAGGIILGAVLLAVILAAALAGGGSTGGGYGCYDDYVCYDYYDGWGFYWYTDCWYETYCY